MDETVPTLDSARSRRTFGARVVALVLAIVVLTGIGASLAWAKTRPAPVGTGVVVIETALIDGHALRLGHGVRIAEDITIEGEDDDAQFVTLGRLAQWVKDRGVTLECSPSSNLQTGAFAAWGDTMADHPFDMLYQLGFRVTVNTDNRLMSATNLTKEIGILSETFGYDADDVLAFQLNAAEAAFIPLEDREELVERLTEGFGAA